MEPGKSPEYAIQNVLNRIFEPFVAIINSHFVPHCCPLASKIAAQRTNGSNAKAAPQHQAN
jgi:hypothetical protein